MMEFDRALTEARKALQKLRDAEARILADADLTHDAKQRRLDEAHRHYRGDVLAIRTMAEGALDDAADDARRALQTAHETDLARRRSLLGDVVLADIARRTVETLSSPELVAHWRSQPTEYESELVRSYARITLQQRMRDEPSTLAHWAAFQEMAHGVNDDVMQAESRLGMVDATRTRLGELDPLQMAQDVSQRTGVPMAHALDAVMAE